MCSHIGPPEHICIVGKFVSSRSIGDMSMELRLRAPCVHAPDLSFGTLDMDSVRETLLCRSAILPVLYAYLHVCGADDMTSCDLCLMYSNTRCLVCIFMSSHILVFACLHVLSHVRVCTHALVRLWWVHSTHNAMLHMHVDLSSHVSAFIQLRFFAITGLCVSFRP